VEYEEMESIRGEINAVVLHSAIVDGINMYLNELERRGILDSERYEQEHYPDSEILRKKWEIAGNVALKYLRPEQQDKG